MSFFNQIGFSRVSEVISLDKMGSSIFQEESLIQLTDWGWLILLIVVIFVVWLLIIFQINSKGAHEWGQISEADESPIEDELVDSV